MPPLHTHTLADVTCAPGALRESILPQHHKPLYIFPVLLKLWISGKGLWNYFHSTLKLSHILLELYPATPVRMKDRTVSSILWFEFQAASIFQDNACRTRKHKMYIREIRPGLFKFLGAQNAHCQDYYYCQFKVMKRLYFAMFVLRIIQCLFLLLYC